MRWGLSEFHLLPFNENRKLRLKVGFGYIPAFFCIVVYLGFSGIVFVEKVSVWLIINLTSAQLGHRSNIVTFL